MFKKIIYLVLLVSLSVQSQVCSDFPEITATSTTICSGTSVTLTASSSFITNANNCALPINLQNGILGYWPFCGNANDTSGNGNNGIVTGANLTSDRFGNINSAYSFDGIIGTQFYRLYF